MRPVWKRNGQYQHENGAPGSARTNIIGDMYVTGQYGKKVIEYSGGQLADWQHRGNLHVALTDKDSSWTGVAAYEQYNDNYGSGGNTMHDIGNLICICKTGPPGRMSSSLM